MIRLNSLRIYLVWLSLERGHALWGAHYKQTSETYPNCLMHKKISFDFTLTERCWLPKQILNIYQAIDKSIWEFKQITSDKSASVCFASETFAEKRTAINDDSLFRLNYTCGYFIDLLIKQASTSSYLFKRIVPTVKKRDLRHPQSNEFFCEGPKITLKMTRLTSCRRLLILFFPVVQLLGFCLTYLKYLLRSSKYSTPLIVSEKGR